MQERIMSRSEALVGELLTLCRHEVMEQASSKPFGTGALSACLKVRLSMLKDLDMYKSHGHFIRQPLSAAKIRN